MASSRLSAWRKGLFTHEDPFSVHKTFGLLCLLHFLTRIPYVASDMRFDASALTPACIAMHTCLSVSSLVFHVPTKRIKEGSRIWPEFRLHSIIFACRSLACMLITWAERRFDPDGEPHYEANVVVVFATLIAADAATRSQPPQARSNTIRGLDMNPVYKVSFALLQFLGTCGCLGGIRAFAAQFAIVFIIQTYAFTLTLRRKNLVTHKQTVYLYSCQLALGSGVASLELWRAGGVDAILMFVSLAMAAFLLRAAAGLPKYAVWTVMAVAMQYARRTTTIVPEASRLAGWPAWGWPAALLACAAGVLALTLRKVAADAAKCSEAAAAKQPSKELNGTMHAPDSTTGMSGRAEASGEKAHLS